MFLSVLFSVVMLILGLSILVIIHELGHFLPAKLFGMRVEKFYLFFDWPRKIFSFKKGDTEYGVGMLPLGGYVKISGIIDESFDKEHLSQPIQPYEFRAKPVWQRMIVMVGGVTMNVILAIIIFSMISFSTGSQRLPMSSLKYGIYVEPGSVGEELGFRTGDKVLSFKGEPMVYMPDSRKLLGYLVEQDAWFEVERAGQPERIEIPNSYLDEVADKRKNGEGVSLFEPNLPNTVTIAEKDGVGAKAGLQDGDRIIALAGTPTPDFPSIRTAISGKENTAVTLSVLRGADTLALTANLGETAKLGIQADASFIVPEVQSYSFFGSFIPGTKAAFGVIGTQLGAFRKMFAGDLAVQKNLAGPVKIAQFLGDGTREGGLLFFFNAIGMLSMVLAFVNILPIPALDGGHLVFLIWEGISGKEPSTKIRMAAQQVGVVLVILLSIFVFANDIFGF